MRALLVVLSVMAAFVLMGVSGYLNYGFMAAFGHTPHAAIILGAAAVAGDILKACLPFFLVLAWRARRLLFLVLGVPAWLLLSAVSLLAAFGYGAEIRDQRAHGRETQSAILRQAIAEEARLMRLDAASSERRAPAEIEAAIAMLRQDARWASSAQCTDATARASRTFCARYHETNGALEAARQRTKHDQQLADVRREIARLRTEGAGLMSEPQVQVLAQMLGASAPRVRTALIVLAALFIEIGSGLGLYLALHHSAPRTLPIRPAIASSRLAPMGARALLHSALMEAYWVARIVPARGACLSLALAWQDYAAWCAAAAMRPMSRSAFDVAFHALAADLRLVCTSAGVRGLALASDQANPPMLPHAHGAREHDTFRIQQA